MIFFVHLIVLERTKTAPKGTNGTLNGRIRVEETCLVVFLITKIVLFYNDTLYATFYVYTILQIFTYNAK